MRKSLLFCLPLALALLLPGCATTPDPDKKQSLQYDTDYVNRVENRARNAGIEVVWINPPFKRTEPNR